MKAAFRRFRRPEEHKKGSFLRDVILGGQDGLVNVLGIVLGVSAAGGDRQILLAAALAATFSEAISMGAVAYTSTLALRDHFQKELERERDEIKNMPEVEREEVRRIYQAKGFSGELLEKVVDKITTSEETWLASMMDEELHLQPVQTSDVLQTSFVVTAAAVVGSLVPVLPFVFFDRVTATVLAVGLSGVALFAIGAYEAVSMVGNWRRHGLQMVAIGLGAAAIGFLIGRIFRVS